MKLQRDTKMRLKPILCVLVLAALAMPVYGQVTAEDWVNKGAALAILGEFDEALQAFDEAIRLDPKATVAWYNKGLTLVYLGKFNEAIQAYDEAIRLDPGYALAWNNKGLAYRALGLHAEADAALARANEIQAGR